MGSDQKRSRSSSRSSKKGSRRRGTTVDLSKVPKLWTESESPGALTGNTSALRRLVSEEWRGIAATTDVDGPSTDTDMKNREVRALIEALAGDDEEGESR